MISSTNIVKASDIDPNHPTGYIVDLSGPDIVNPDCYWRFNLRHEARQFANLVNAGMAPREAYHRVYPNI
jgi:hypothetical protein